jgi:predicted nucleic acid-binding protein
VPLLYAESSALVKLVRDEAESGPLRAYVAGADLMSCELVLAEVPRAIRRAAHREPVLGLERLLRRADELLDGIALLPLERGIFAAAGALAEPRLRALDAIHIAAALDLSPLDGFISYDERQSAAARLLGIRTVAPGV